MVYKGDFSMHLIKLISAFCLAAVLCSCQGGAGGAGVGTNSERAPSCILEAEDYILRVVRGEKRLEFTSPELLCGVSVVFDSEGKCTLCYGVTPNSDGESITPDTDAANASGNGAGLADTVPTGGADAEKAETVGADVAQIVNIPLEDERGWLDWLVAAYPEDWLSEEQRAQEDGGTFSLNGADFSFSGGTSSDGSDDPASNGTKLTITRAGVSRSAVRSDEK